MSAKPQLPSWFRARRYAHFDLPPDALFAVEYACNSARVASHAFWPFLSYDKKSPKFTRDPVTGKRSNGGTKVRPICYAAHLDSHIFARYASELSERLEAYYAKNTVGASVLAYRKLRPGKSNISHAREAFGEIAARGDVDAIALDVADFFGSLDHAQLKQSWTDLLGSGQRLPDDHYAVMRAVTQYTTVKRDDLAQLLGRVIPKRQSRIANRVCTPAEFRESVRPKLLVPQMERVRARRAGIPQGSPISAVLANLYMLRADELICAELSLICASYRRYSDDILIVCRPGDGLKAEAVVVSQLAKLNLEVKLEKTVRIAFRQVAECVNAFAIDCNGAVTPQERPLSYLGLEWNGKEVRLRSATIAKFIARMTRAVRGAYLAAIKNGETDLRRIKLYRKFSRLGVGARILKFTWGRTNARWPGHPSNFIFYGQNAARICRSDAMDRQLGALWGRLQRELAKADKKLSAR